jgi:hypothetical protein
MTTIDVTASAYHNALLDIRLQLGLSEHAEHEEVTDAIRELVADAERYRWLRDDCAFADLAEMFNRNPEDIDPHIDAARSADNSGAY